jgi:hypothetical protein
MSHLTNQHHKKSFIRNRVQQTSNRVIGRILSYIQGWLVNVMNKHHLIDTTQGIKNGRTRWVI